MRYESKKISTSFYYFLNYSGTKYRNMVIYINYFQIMVIKTLKNHLIFHIFILLIFGVKLYPTKGFILRNKSFIST
jgi:hypothetical protein